MDSQNMANEIGVSPTSETVGAAYAVIGVPNSRHAWTDKRGRHPKDFS